MSDDAGGRQFPWWESAFIRYLSLWDDLNCCSGILSWSGDFTARAMWRGMCWQLLMDCCLPEDGAWASIKYQPFMLRVIGWSSWSCAYAFPYQHIYEIIIMMTDYHCKVCIFQRDRLYHAFELVGLRSAIYVAGLGYERKHYTTGCVIIIDHLHDVWFLSASKANVWSRYMWCRDRWWYCILYV